MSETQTVSVDEKTVTQVNKDKVSYDIHVLMSPTTSEEGLTRTRDDITKILEDSGAHIKRSNQFSKSHLAYPIEKNSTAYTASIQFLAAPDTIHEIRKTIALLEEGPLRYLLSKEPKKIIQKNRRRKPAHLLEKTPFQAEKNIQKGYEAGDENTSPEMVKDAEGVEKTESFHVKEESEKSVASKDDKVTLDDIDKKLDEIMGNL